MFLKSIFLLKGLISESSEEEFIERRVFSDKDMGLLEVVKVLGQADLQLLRLDDGILLCSFGRPSVNLMFRLKEDGSDWSKPFVFYDRADHHDTSLLPLGETRFALVSYWSGFCGHSIEEPNELRMTKYSLLRE